MLNEIEIDDGRSFRCSFGVLITANFEPANTIQSSNSWPTCLFITLQSTEFCCEFLGIQTLALISEDTSHFNGHYSSLKSVY